MPPRVALATQIDPGRTEPPVSALHARRPRAVPVLAGLLALGTVLAACSGSGAASSDMTAVSPTTSPAAPAATTAPATATAAPATAVPTAAPSVVAASMAPATSSGMPAGSIGEPGGVAAPAATDAEVPYATVSASQVLDIWLPTTGARPFPLVILVHGGAFMGGDKAMEGANVRAVLAAGYAAASLDYRLSGEAIFPAAARDVKAAVRFLRANAGSYGIDPDRFAAWGESAGGNLVALIGTTGDRASVLDDPALGNAGVSSAVAAVVDWYGPTNFLLMDAQFAAASPAACNGTTQAHDPADSPESAYLGAAIQTVPDLARASNPITYIAAAGSLPAWQIAHGDSDCQVPSQQSAILDDALRAAGATTTFNLVAGAGHGDQAFTVSQTASALAMLASIFGR